MKNCVRALVCILVRSHLCLWKDGLFLFWLLFVKSSFLRANHWPLIWEDSVLFRSSQQLNIHHLGPLTFLSWHGALQGRSMLPCKLLPELERYKDNVKFGALAAESQPWQHTSLQHISILSILDREIVYIQFSEVTWQTHYKHTQRKTGYLDKCIF